MNRIYTYIQSTLQKKLKSEHPAALSLRIRKDNMDTNNKGKESKRMDPVSQKGNKLVMIKENNKFINFTYEETNNTILNNVQINDTTVIKCKLKDIIRPEKYDVVLQKLTDVGLRINKLIIYNYQFIRAYILYCYEKKETIPEITKQFIKISFHVFFDNKEGNEKKKRGRQFGKESLELLEKLTAFYKLYEERFNVKLVKGLHLSQIIEYTATSMVTAIENNIKLHFCYYLKHFVNAAFSDKLREIREITDKKEKSAKLKEFRKDMGKLKSDLIDGKYNQKYDTWMTRIRKSMFPPKMEVSLRYDLNKEPQKYLKYMILMNRYNETHNSSQLQFFPLRTEKVIKYFPLDTKSIVKILSIGHKEDYLENITENENLIWDEFFDLNNKIFRRKNHTFTYMIYTNCYAVSILFKHNSVIDKSKAKKKKKIDGKKKNKKNAKLTEQKVELDNIQKGVKKEQLKI